MGINEKYLMIHADDAGLSHSENQATMECLKKGMVNSYSIMVPCAGFEEIVEFAKEHPMYDHGIHLTLTCEWHAHRFGPVLPISEVPSLVDKHGCFHKSRQGLRGHAQSDEVYNELKAQIEMAYNVGLQPSHLDSHMYSVGSSSALFTIYKKLGQEYDLPVLINKKLMQMTGLDIISNVNSTDFIFENAHFAVWDDFEKGHLKSRYLEILEELTPGMNILLIHPAFDDGEMKQITVDHPNFGSAWRQMDFDTFTSEETQKKLAENNIELISWKEINERFRH